MSERIFGDTIPEEALEAFHKGSQGGTWNLDGVRIKVERDRYPTGKGYDMRFRLTPQVES